MMQDDIHRKAEEVSALMAERLGLRGADLSRQVARAGRLMPRAVAREAQYLAQTAALAQNPKLMRMVDPDKVARAHGIVRDFLRAQNPRERRRTALLGVAGVVAFNLLVIALGLIGWLVWRGRV